MGSRWLLMSVNVGGGQFEFLRHWSTLDVGVMGIIGEGDVVLEVASDDNYTSRRASSGRLSNPI